MSKRKTFQKFSMASIRVFFEQKNWQEFSKERGLPEFPTFQRSTKAKLPFRHIRCFEHILQIFYRNDTIWRCLKGRSSKSFLQLEKSSSLNRKPYSIFPQMEYRPEFCLGSRAYQSFPEDVVVFHEKSYWYFIIRSIGKDRLVFQFQQINWSLSSTRRPIALIRENVQVFVGKTQRTQSPINEWKTSVNLSSLKNF